MHRRTLALDDRAWEMLELLLEDGLCLCGIVTDGDGRPVDYRFLRVSQGFEAATGLRDAEGRTALELVPDLEARWIEAYGRVALGGETLRFVDGSAAMGRVFDVQAVPADPPGCFAILFRDITALRRAAEEREAARLGAEALLAELSHRVMNSFASIGAVVAMEARAAAPEARPAFDRLQGRVRAMGELYRRLDGAARIDQVEMGAFLDGVAAAFRESLGAGLEVEARAEAMWLPTRAAVPLALVANELMSEAARRPGATRVSLALEVADGAGRLLVEGDGQEEAEAEGRDAVGRSLVRAFVAELGARLDSEPLPGGGRRVAVALPPA